VKHLALVCLGGAFGSGLRYGTTLLLARLTPKLAAGFPLATLAVNFVGCFAIGLGAGLLSRDGIKYGPELQLFLLVGVCGGLTTFSAFANQTLELATGKALLNICASVVGGLFLAWIGLLLAGARTA
jgi:CrcB protein